MQKTLRFLTAAAALTTVAALLCGCAAGTGDFSAEQPAGFWAGLWHGAISVITLIIHIFSPGVRVYELHNTGGWYDLGFLLGVICIWGGGSSAGYIGSARRRKDDLEWDDVGAKVEKKIMRRLREFAKARPEDDWDEVERKLERELRENLKKWAESDE